MLVLIHNDLLEIKVLTVNKLTEIMKVFFVVSLYCIIQSKVTENFHCLECLCIKMFDTSVCCSNL